MGERFWADDFDADLLRVIPGAAAAIGDAADIPLWTYGGASHGRLNHPAVWNGDAGMIAFLGTDDTGTWKPASYRTDKPLVACTWQEVARDAWAHHYLVAVDGEPVWNTWRLSGVFLRLMFHERGRPRLPDIDAERLRGEVLASLIGATCRLQQHVEAVRR